MHSLWRRNTVLTGGEWDTPLAVPPLLGRPLRRVAILGNAGGTTARAMGVFYPQARIDGVELDPDVTAVGRRLLRAGRQPPPARDHGGRAAVPPQHRRQALRPDHRRRLPAPVRARSPRDAGVLPVWPGRGSPPGARSSSTSGRRPTTTGSPRASQAPWRRSSRFVLTWQALRFNQFVIGLDRPRAASRARPATASRASSGLRSLTNLLVRDMRRRGSLVRPVDGRSRARRVDHGPDDPRVRGARRPLRGVPAADGALAGVACDAAVRMPGMTGHPPEMTGRHDRTQPKPLRLQRGEGPSARDRPPRRSGARAGKHDRGCRRCARARRRPRRARRLRRAGRETHPQPFAQRACGRGL